MPKNNAFNLLVETNFGQMLVNPNDQFIGQALLQYGEYSWDEILLLEQLITTDSTIIEVGANIGAHSVPLAQRIETTDGLYAFEPQRLVFQQLCANIALNQLSNVQTHWAAMGKEAGEITFPDLSPYNTHNFGGVSYSDKPKQNSADFITIPKMTIDNLSLTQCNLIKIDVEGMELDVINGATNTIQRTRPALYVEADKREKIAALISTIKNLDYKLWWHTPLLIQAETLKQKETKNSTTNLATIISCNMICLPKEKDIPVTKLKPVKGENDWPFEDDM